MVLRPGVLACVLLTAACGDDSGLSDYYPELPPTGGAQEVFAGEVSDPAQLVGGPAVSGLVGDFYIKNDRVTFIVQAPTRVIGVIPQGGNVVDAVLTEGGTQVVDDHFGELGLIYLLGRTCEPTRIEIVRDGSKGGAAVLRSIGKTGNDDFLNLKGIGVLRVDEAVDPDIEDGVDCATTYVLAPGSTTLEVHHSLFNGSDHAIDGPLGTLADTGGHTEAWTNARGFERADISAIATLGTPQPIDYVIYQGPGVAYGVIPRHPTPTVHTQALIAGVSILLDGNESLLDILQKDKYFLRMPAGKGFLQSYDLVVGRDGADVDEVFRRGEELQAVSGRVDFSAGGPAAGARVGVFLDGNGNGQLDPEITDNDGDGQPDDKILSYMDVAADGTFSGKVPTTAGNLLLRAEVKNVGRSAAAPVADTVSFTVPSPIKVDYQILDAATDAPIPGRLLVVGDHPSFPDQRVFETYDRADGVVASMHAIRGTTVDVGDGVDPALVLPAGGTYRIYASRGTEWSIDSQPVTASGSLTFRIRHVNPAIGYIGSDWHVHQVGSPDSNVLSEERIRSAVSAGLEMFAVTDHDYVSDLQPMVESMQLADLVRAIPGIEVTPFAYGHFNTWPIIPDTTSANHGAIDWARGAGAGFAMTPAEVYDAMRARGGQIVQVNHPRGSGFTEFQAAFSRANVKYDYAARTIYGDYEDSSVPNDWLRLPGESLWSDQFNGLEVWNGFTIVDTNTDGLRENKSLDRVMRDWISMLSLGLFVTPTGNSDTHTSTSDPVGMPRTYVRVPDDSPAALASGAAVDAALATQTGANSTPRDIVVTNGPMIDVKVGGQPALGRVFPIPTGQAITITVAMTSPDWAEFDTLEVFANSTPDPVGRDDITTLAPLGCWTSRNLGTLDPKDPCAAAPMPAQAMTVTLATIAGPGNVRRYQATVTVTLDAQDIVTRAGATGSDAWLVFRVRGDRAIFPILPNNAINATTRPAIMSGDFATIRTALTGKGVPAAAFTTPVFVDFDGGGYRAPFAP
ncbi:MAG: PHP domain-containing protein [Deltaproteobacteria bacterium]|nr:PHP domain-containing protein [Deltaproteobacteria bacterium]MDQ3296629.1 CehA/McbA family metallohydrolase [Myxococcota bacterium]